MSQIFNAAIAVVGIDIGKNTFHVGCLGRRGAIMLRRKWSRGQVEARFANMPPCLIGVEARVGAHHLSRKLKELGHSPVPSATLFGTNDDSTPKILAKRMVKGIKTSQHQPA
jgi:transposase